MNNINFISEQYLFSPELVEALTTGKIPDKNENVKYIEKNDDSIYLVFIRILNREDKKLVYNYVSYNQLFMTPLIVFLKDRSRYNAEYFSEWGRYFVVIESVDQESLSNKLD